MAYRQIVAFILMASALIGCTDAPNQALSTSTPTSDESLQISATPITTAAQSPTPQLLEFRFPDSVDPANQYLFYLHGKIVEDQGIPAISPDFGEYEYEAILERIGGFGFVVISEQRPKNADAVEYAKKIAAQVTTLLNADVLGKNITIVGASKGAGIAIFVSRFLENEEINFVIMGICHPDTVESLKRDQIFLYGDVLSIYDSADELAGSCQDLFSFSTGRGISRHDEVVLNIGTGHGILYQPLDDWILPLVQWASNHSE